MSMHCVQLLYVLLFLLPQFLSIYNMNRKACCFPNNVLNIYLFLGQRETEHERGRGRERGRHRIGNRLQALSHQPEPDAGLELTDREIVTWLKSDA